MKMPEQHRMTLKPPTHFRFDKTEVGWKLIQDMAPGMTLGVIMFERISPNEGAVIPTRTALRTARKRGLAVVGQHHAEAMLEAEIPVELRGLSLICAGTQWKDDRDAIWYPYLHFCSDESRWKISFKHLYGALYEEYARLVCIAP